MMTLVEIKGAGRRLTCHWLFSIKWCHQDDELEMTFSLFFDIVIYPFTFRLDETEWHKTPFYGILPQSYTR